MSSQIKVHFSAAEFEASHLRQPRGTGSWAFQVTEIDGHEGEGEVVFSPSLTLTAAKKWFESQARAFAKTVNPHAGSVTVSILP